MNESSPHKDNHNRFKYYRKILFIKAITITGVLINPNNMITNSYHPFLVSHTIFENKIFYRLKVPISQFQIYFQKLYCIFQLIKQPFIPQLWIIILD